jgi:putative hydroxymethylpyrimidine transporter CytX
MSNETPNWGIEPVPERMRVLGFTDTTLLWLNLGVSLLVLAAGTQVIQGLTLRSALIAVLVGGLIGNAMLGLAGLIGNQARVPGMVLLRAPLGERGSYLATILNVVQNLGWAIFELIVIATAASALADRAFGFHGRWLWTLLFGATTTVFAVLGPISVVRTWIRRFAFWAVLASLAWLTWWAIDGAGSSSVLAIRGKGDFGFWQAVDLTIAMPVSWLPLIADYTRFSRNRRSAFWGGGLGYLIPNLWLYGLGALLALTRGLTGSKSDAARIFVLLAGAGFASVLALIALTVDETDEPFANVYSAALSLQNVFPRAPQRLLVLAVGSLSTAGALTIGFGQYPLFLFLIGSFFVPLFGVLAADWLLRGGYDRDALFAAPRVRPAQLFAWAAGFAFYQWLYPTGPTWWTDLVAHLHPQSLGIGASLPALALSFVLSAVASMFVRRRQAGVAEPSRSTGSPAT